VRSPAGVFVAVRRFTKSRDDKVVTEDQHGTTRQTVPLTSTTSKPASPRPLQKAGHLIERTEPRVAEYYATWGVRVICWRAASKTHDGRH
jgi:hypothetical protein